MLTIITPVYCQSKSDHIYERTLFLLRGRIYLKKLRE